MTMAKNFIHSRFGKVGARILAFFTALFLVPAVLSILGNYMSSASLAAELLIIFIIIPAGCLFLIRVCFGPRIYHSVSRALVRFVVRLFS